MQKPSNQTVEKIDFVIQGLENGLFEDLANKIDFHQKLKGTPSIQFVDSLIHELEVAQADIVELKNKQLKAEQQIRDFDNKFYQNEIDTKALAKAIKYLFNPDALAKAYDLNEFTSFLVRKGIH